MQGRYGFFAIVLALLSLVILFVPQRAFAELTVDTTSVPSPGTIGFSPPQAVGPSSPTATTQCPSGNSIDNAARTNTSAQVQALFTAAKNVSSQFPIAPSQNACLKQLTDLFSSLANFAGSTSAGAVADPFGIASGVISSMLSSFITNIIGQACTAVMGIISSVTNALKQITTLCLPLPKFGGLDLPTSGLGLNQPTCSGGMSINFLTGSSSSSSTAIYNYSQYLH